MSSVKTKKKSKSEKIPKPIKIKKEDDHIMYPMEHYVDDRVELIRQIFSSLKPKTITNLAPEFLKKNKLEDIQEQCLNEILGISKKRLLSIINSTKCPTDTDTSEEDVHSVEEHISLEEISSDSDIVEQNGPKNPKSDDKQFSVLELLELQARARAIRSQLALEPVTKIEVDTDSENGEPPIKKAEQATSTSKKRQKSTNGNASSSKSLLKHVQRPMAASVTAPNGQPAPTAPVKRVKLKRNFRKQTRDDDSNDEAKKDGSLTITIQNIQPKKEVRSPSPDVIPIIPVPETLCISDSDDEKKCNNDTAKDTETAKPVEKSKPVEILSVVNIEPLTKPNENTDSIQTESPIVAPREVTPVEREEGEILEDEVKTKSAASEKSDSPTPIAESNEKNLKSSTDEVVTSRDISQNPCATVQTTSIASIEPSDNKPQNLDTSDSDGESNDDVISLEGGDLLNEMKEHLKDEIDETKDAKEVICLDDSSDEETNDKKELESWNERWLKSSKVSKVLATSRLGNRVRNKIKESKKATKLKEAAIIESELSKPQEVIFTSRHEDGSIDQYKELLEKIKAKAD